MPARLKPAGRFFVMELVRGVKITDYCNQHSLSTRERLDLFVQVCRAVQHAHQKGIAHRDIKPSNILVTVNDGVAVPKVIDFGIAKATQGRLTDQTLFTAFEQFIGTPAYMSPEQAVLTSLDIDTRTDIYSLGVLLYELLTDRTPFVLLGYHSVAISPDGERVAAGSNGQEAIKLWDLHSHEEVATISGQGSFFSDARFSPDGSTISARNWNGVIYFWTAPAWKQIEAAEQARGRRSGLADGVSASRMQVLDV